MTVQDPFLSVRHFVAVARTGSFTAAALGLGLTDLPEVTVFAP